MTSQYNPLSEGCLLLPLTSPRFVGTLDEYLIARIADHLRHAGEGISSRALPFGSYPVEDNTAPSTIPPETVAPAATATTSGPKPSPSSTGTQVGVDNRDGIARSSSGTTYQPAPPPHSDLPHLSVNLAGLRIIEPMRAEAPRRTNTAATLESLQDAHGSRDSMSLMQIYPSIASQIYTIQFGLDLTHHPQSTGKTYKLGVDTAGLSTWIYGKGYQQVPEQTDCDVNPDTIPLSPKLAAIEREYVIPVNIRGEVMPFTTSGSPRPPNEWAVRYVDGAAVYVRYIPNSAIKANIPCWSWTENKETTCPLPLLSVLAFGANDIAIEFPPVDGIIGLSVPHVSSLADWRHSISHRVQFIDALENPKSRVYEPRHFLMKLNHPDKIIDCHNSGAHNLLYFGEDFPCVLKPRFTPKLAVYPTSGKLDPPGNRPWMLGLESMSLIVPNHDPFEFKIDMINPFRDNASALPEYDNMIHVVLDSCTSATYLPAYVADAIRHKWLQNSQDILKLDENEEVRRYTGYCGPERDLHDCDIVFTFVGEDGQSVNFQCPALPFLKSHYPLPSHKHESPPTRFICSVGSFADSKIPDKDRSYFILGINFYWSAFIDHCGMIKDPTTPVSDYSKFSSPYVRLAPQRARKEDGTMGHAEDFSFLRDVAPKFYEPVQET